MTVKHSGDVSSSAVSVAVWPEAFAPHCEMHTAPAGANIAQIIALACQQGSLDPIDAPRTRLFLDGCELELRDSLDLIPAAGSVVNLNVTVHGSSARTFTQLFFAIGSVVVTFMFGPIWGAVVAMAGSVVDYLVFNQKPDSLSSNAGGALSDLSNNYRRRESFPLVLGRQRVGFDVAALPYTENVGDDVWLHAIFGVHFGACDIEDIKIGETLLSDYPAADYQIEIRDRPGPRNLTLYPGRVHQENLNVELDFTGSGVWEVQTFQEGATSGQVDITWPQGLSARGSTGKLRPEEVRGRIEIAEVGSSAWTPVQLGEYRDKNGTILPVGDWYINTRSGDPIRRTFPVALDPDQQWKVRVKAWDQDGDFPGDEGHTWATFWTALRSYWPGKPILDENLSVIALRIKSSGDLNGSLPLFSGVVEPVIPIFQGGQWRDAPADHRPSSNPAALTRWLCTGPAAQKPLLTSEINASFGAGYDLIEERDWKGSIDVREDGITLADAIQALGRMGRFNCYWNGSELCLVSDWEKPAPRQLFTGKNAEGYRYRRTFRPSPHGVFVEFKSLEAESDTAELLVYSDGYDETNAEDFAALTLDFACMPERAFREGRVYLAKLIHQAESHEWTAGIESIVASYGDRVLVRHATALFGRAEARVRNRRMAGALVAGFRLSDPVVIEAGKTYAIDIQRDDQIIRGVEVSAPGLGLQRDLSFSAPVVASQAPKAGDLIAFGELGFVTEDLEIVDIQPDGPTASISAVRYAAAEIEAAETGPIPPLPNLLTPRPVAPRPRLLGEPTGSPDGVKVAFDVDPLRAANLSGFTARYRLASAVNEGDVAAWISLPPLGPNARLMRTPPFPEAQTALEETEARFLVDVEIRSTLTNGARSQPLTILNIGIRRPVPAPLDFFAEGVIRVGPDDSSYSAMHVGCDPLEAGIVQTLQVEVAPDDGSGPAEGTFRPLGRLPASNPEGDFRNVDGGEYYAVRARWVTADQWASSWVQFSGEYRIRVPAGGNVSNDTILVGGENAVDIVNRLATAEGLVETTAAQVEALELVYGDTASAAASAIAAAASASDAAVASAAAIIAQGGAETASSAASISAGNASVSASAAATSATNAAGSASTATTQAGLAAGSATAAGGSATAANTSAGLAATSATASGNSATASQTARVAAESARDAAAGSATAAATSASNASTSATAAGTSATAASTSATNASTSAGNASTSAGAASTSATNALGSQNAAALSATAAANSATAAGGSATAAAGSASTASTQATNAGNSAAAAAAAQVSAESTYAAAVATVRDTLITPVFGADIAKYYSTAGFAPPADMADLSASRVVSTDQGVTIRIADDTYVNAKGYIPNKPGATYRINARARWYAGDVAANFAFYGRELSSTFTGAGDAGNNGFQTFVTKGAWTDIVLEWTNNIAAESPGFRPRFRNTVAASGIEVTSFYVTDITAEVASRVSASAAATSASSASTSAGAAGVSASAAASSATTASTARGQAQTFAGQASDARDDAVSARITAQSAATTASTAAGTATTQASSASASAAEASLSASLAVSMGTGGGVNRDPTFQNWPAGQPRPSNMETLTGTVVYTRVTASPRYGDKGLRLGVTTTAAAQARTISDGLVPMPATVTHVVFSYEITLISGSFNSAGLAYRNRLESGGDNLAVTSFLDNHGAGVAGRSYSGDMLVAMSGPGTFAPDLQAIQYLLNNSTVAGTNVAKTIQFHRVNVRAATPEEIAANTVIPALQAQAAITAGAVVDLESQVGNAFIDLVAAAGGNPARILLKSGPAGSMVALAANAIVLQSVIGGTVIKALEIVAGKARFSSDVEIMGNLIVAGTVTTPKLETGAVTQTVTQHNRSGSLNQSTPVAINTVNILGVLAASVVDIMWSTTFRIRGGSLTKVSYRINRRPYPYTGSGSVLIHSGFIDLGSIGIDYYAGPAVMPFTDNPGAGDWIYLVEAWSDINSAPVAQSFTNGSLQVSERKK